MTNVNELPKETLLLRKINLTKVINYHKSILKGCKKSNTIDGKFWHPNELRRVENNLPDLKELLKETVTILKQKQL